MEVLNFFLLSLNFFQGFPQHFPCFMQITAYSCKNWISRSKLRVWQFQLEYLRQAFSTSLDVAQTVCYHQTFRVQLGLTLCSSGSSLSYGLLILLHTLVIDHWRQNINHSYNVRLMSCRKLTRGTSVTSRALCSSLNGYETHKRDWMVHTIKF